MYIMGKKNCNTIDKQTIDEFKMPGIILMENAANEVFLELKTWQIRHSYMWNW